MATLMTRLLVPILLINLLAIRCFALAVSPGSPGTFFPPKCYMPCSEAYINCTWDAWPDPLIPANYSLHWESDSEEQHVSTGNKLSGCIDREKFSKVEISVWVQAKNQYGHINSEKVELNTRDIIKPPPPEFKPNPQDPLEIIWEFMCNGEHLSQEGCDVRQRTEEDPSWHEESGFYDIYTVDKPKPCVTYEVQVRCPSTRGLKSDWSAIHKVQDTESAPIGRLDVWRDCGISSASSDCVLTWKRLSTSQGCGLILVYEVRLLSSSGAVALWNVSTAVPMDQLVCDEAQCYLKLPLKDAVSVSISAYNSRGASSPSYLTMPASGKEKNWHLSPPSMSEEILTVSWDESPHILKNLREYLVQYKQAGSPPGQGFDWVKLDKNQTSAIFKGQFKKYTPYQVSLFTVSDSNETHYQSSVIGYYLQGTPPRLLSFKVSAIGATYVTVCWEPIPLLEQTGKVILYQIGVDGRQPKEYNVSAEHTSFEVQHLNPGQKYDVWIQAMTEAGFGEKYTTNFETTDQEHGYLTKLIGICLLIILIVIVSFSVCVCFYQRKNKACPLLSLYKVPDPRNSGIFREMKHQINDSMVWMCIPINEPHPKICLLEIVEIHPLASKTSMAKSSEACGLTQQMDGDESCQSDPMEDTAQEESHRTDRKGGREAYSRMVDSDEEKDREEEDEELEDEKDSRDCWSSSEDEQCTSGYEKHFMPTALEMQEVS